MQRLLAAGLLRQVDAEHVILPRLVGQLMRGEHPAPPPHRRRSRRAHRQAPKAMKAADVDAAAAGAAIDLLREIELVFETLGAAPIPELRSGGLGVRERQATDQGHRHRASAGSA